MNDDLSNVLLELELEQIIEVQRKYKERYPDDKQTFMKCQNAIEMKKTQQRRCDFIALIEEVKNKNAPDSAATPSKGE